MRTALLAVLLLSADLVRPDDPEAEVKRDLDAARKVVADAEEALQKARDEVGFAYAVLREKRIAAEDAEARLKELEKQLAAVENTIQTSEKKIIDQVDEAKKKLAEAEKVSPVDPDNIADLKRAVTAVENWLDRRLQKSGLKKKKEDLEKKLPPAREALTKAKAALAEPEARIREALKGVQTAEAVLAEAKSKLATVEIEAPARLKRTEPPLLLRVVAKDDRGVERYRAVWVSKKEEVDKRIEAAREAIRQQKIEIETDTQRIDDLIALLIEQNKACEALLADYVSAVYSQAWKHSLTELGDSALSIARDWKTWGPFAFPLEAVSKVSDAIRGKGTPAYALPENKMAFKGAGTDLAPYGWSALENTAKNVIKHSLEAAAAGPDGMGLMHTSSTVNKEFKRIYWAHIRSVVLGGVERHVVNDCWRVRNVRDFFKGLKSHAASGKWHKDLLLDVAQGVAKDLVQKHWDDDRLKVWRKYHAADLIRYTMRDHLRQEGALRDFDRMALKQMEIVLDEFIRERDSADHCRELRREKDDVFNTKEICEIEIEFTREVKINKITVGGAELEGRLKGKTWSSGFNPNNKGDIAWIVVDAEDAVTKKKLDDPTTEARYAPRDERWNGYEPDLDKHHRLKLKPVKEGVSYCFLFDCSGSMNDNSRMANSKRAAERVLTSKTFGPDDEFALYAFFDCGRIDRQVAFTRDPDAVLKSVQGLSPSGATPLADGMTKAAAYLKAAARNKKRVLVILTDGEDT